MIGGGERKLVERFLGPGKAGLLEEAFGLYLDYYSRHCGDYTLLYPGVTETLSRLEGKKLAVLSNKQQSLSEAVLRALGIFSFFAAVRGGGGELPLKPSPVPLLAVIKETGAAAGNAAHKPGDIQAGKGAGTFTLGVTYGYGEPAALAAAAPDFLIHSFPELTGILSQ